MRKELINNAYIDNTNLYKGFESEGFSIDYIKFRKYLTERHGVKTAYIFIGFIPENQALYKKLKEYGYELIFKPTIPSVDGIKGNCDGELILRAVSDFYERKYSKAIIVTSDGDFACLANFLKERDALDTILSPRLKCSMLLKQTKAKIMFLVEIAHLITRRA